MRTKSEVRRGYAASDQLAVCRSGKGKDEGGSKKRGSGQRIEVKRQKPTRRSTEHGLRCTVDGTRLASGREEEGGDRLAVGSFSPEGVAFDPEVRQFAGPGRFPVRLGRTGDREPFRLGTDMADADVGDRPQGRPPRMSCRK